ncbi:MAG: hypothetical protein ACRELY_28700 [Polyangiaceae bacterium]
MRTVLAIALFCALLAFLCAHVSLVAGIARTNKVRALLSIVIPPLAPFWGYELGLHRRAHAWLGALASYVALSIAFSV